MRLTENAVKFIKAVLLNLSEGRRLPQEGFLNSTLVITDMTRTPSGEIEGEEGKFVSFNIAEAADHQLVELYILAREKYLSYSPPRALPVESTPVTPVHPEGQAPRDMVRIED